MLFPLVEHRINSLLGQINSENITSNREEYALLIDEPELHLHPSLQLKLVDYFRLIVSQEPAQIIMTTQSPEIIDYASSDELFILKPSDVSAPDVNQFSKLLNDEAELASLRSALGSKYSLTALRPIVVVEGSNSSQGLSDRRLYRALSPYFDQVNLVGGSSKSEAQRLRRDLANVFERLSVNVNAYALLDRDTTSYEADALVSCLPVSMIENFLLDPDAIWDTIQFVAHGSAFRSSEDVAKRLRSILSEMRQQEVERRVVQALQPFFFRASRPLATLSARASEQASELSTSYDASRIDELTSEMSSRVDQIISEDEMFRQFDGKAALRTFFRDLHGTGYSFDIFRYEIARRVSKKEHVLRFFTTFFVDTIGLPVLDA